MWGIMEQIIYTLVFGCTVILLIVWSYLFLKIKEKSVLTEMSLIMLYVFSSFWLFVSGTVLGLNFIIFFMPAIYVVTFVIEKIHNKTRLLKIWSFYGYTLLVGVYVAFITYVLLVGWALNSIFKG